MLGGSTNVVSDRFVQFANRCISVSVRRWPSSTTASALPAYGVAVKTSTWRKLRCMLASIAPVTEPLISDDVRAFLEQPRFAVMATINKWGRPQLTVMWYALATDGATVVVLNATRGLLKERNLRRDPRMSLCIEDGM